MPGKAPPRKMPTATLGLPRVSGDSSASFMRKALQFDVERQMWNSSSSEVRSENKPFEHAAATPPVPAVSSPTNDLLSIKKSSD